MGPDARKIATSTRSRLTAGFRRCARAYLDDVEHSNRSEREDYEENVSA